ncbi:aminopeptidase P family protein [Halogeometricum borinquense]|uniref:Aminopeptidase P family protein n=1 Tax=Halogeometricum borinquense TaxID=60847 RepID=A0A6C0UM96_9EURY|nr:Xaa-Pro peptidase family protein [Halogeometricum borinquense]QIB74058.1 aminopeptidase P family protein [Halogeometricum borinquense]QIQ76732.1 aminopeptidase P family protein [Halogeometricum borinquense]
MDPDFSPLDDLLEAEDADGYLVDDTSHNSTQKYLSGFEAHDPFVTLYTPEKTILLVSALEYGRAKKQSRADEVRRVAEYDYRELVSEHGPAEAKARAHAEFLNEYDVASVLTPERFPLGPADGLRERGVAVEAEESDRVTEIRATKTDEEIEHVRAAQDANEEAMRAAENLIAAADVEDGTLVYEGEPLTSERVKEEIEVTLLRHGCGLDDTIVACGANAADPHDQGSGPLHADEAIIIDIFPRSKETGYHADMTRTFVKGDPSEEIRERFDLTHEALNAALDAVEPGVTGADVHDVVCDIYEEAGYDTLRSNATAETGFIHSTGHGVGLDVHELPRIASNGEELKPGHIITIEPGLYDPSVGGVRIEDIVVVTEDGYENLTSYPVELVV